MKGRELQRILNAFDDLSLIDLGTEEKQRYPKTIKTAIKNNTIALMDPSNVLYVEPLNDKSLKFMYTYVCDDLKQYTKQEKIFNKEDNLKQGTCRFALDYLKKILNLSNAIGCDGPVLTVYKDYPCQILLKGESNGLEFKVVLAPRIDHE